MIIIKKNEVEKLFTAVENPKTKIIIDLEKQTIVIPSKSILISFQIDEFKKNNLLNGADELEFILSQEKKIAEFEKKHKLYLI